MRLVDDDELYEVDQTYLGPPGRYIGTFRFKAIAAWLALGPLTFVVMRQTGVPMNLLTVGLTLMGISVASGAIADAATPERPVTSLVATFMNDLKARRRDTTAHAAAATGYARRVRPGGPLGKWLKRTTK